MARGLRSRVAYTLLVAAATLQSVCNAAATVDDDEFQVEVEVESPPVVVDQATNPQDAYFQYMSYLNKAVPLLGVALLLFVYFGMGALDPKETIKGPKVHVSHILVKEEVEADALRKQIKNSAKKSKAFAELAARKSSCPSKSKGGHMGVFGKGQMMPEFDKIVFTEPVGSIHVVKTKFGWHVLMITKRDELPGDLKRKKL